MTTQPEFEGVLFVGSKTIGLKSLRALIGALPGSVAGAVTIDDSMDSRSALTEFRTLTENAQIPLEVVGQPSQLVKVINRVRPVCAFVVGWYWLLPSSVLDRVPNGVVGIHASLLPDLRGSAPLVWALLTGRQETGVTLFYFDEGIDSGDVIGQRSFSIRKDHTLADLVTLAEAAAEALIDEHARSVLQGTAPRRSQDDSVATYGTIRRPADGQINWSQTSEEILGFVRAQTRPYPGAFTLIGSSTVRVWSASYFSRPLYGIPGVVVQLLDDHPVVATGDGAVVIDEYEIEADGSQEAGQLRVGTRFQ